MTQSDDWESIQDLKLLTDYELNEEEADIDYE